MRILYLYVYCQRSFNRSEILDYDFLFIKLFMRC